MKFDTELAAHVPWKKAYAFVERETRGWLIDYAIGREPLSTDQLVEKLYPEKLARGDGILARQRIYKALAALATRELADCARRGETFKRFGKERKRWTWIYPQVEMNDEYQPRALCPHCGGEL